MLSPTLIILFSISKSWLFITSSVGSLIIISSGSSLFCISEVSWIDVSIFEVIGFSIWFLKWSSLLLFSSCSLVKISFALSLCSLEINSILIFSLSLSLFSIIFVSLSFCSSFLLPFCSSLNLFSLIFSFSSCSNVFNSFICLFILLVTFSLLIDSINSSLFSTIFISLILGVFCFLIISSTFSLSLNITFCCCFFSFSPLVSSITFVWNSLIVSLLINSLLSSLFFSDMPLPSLTILKFGSFIFSFSVIISLIFSVILFTINLSLVFLSSFWEIINLGSFSMLSTSNSFCSLSFSMVIISCFSFIKSLFSFWFSCFFLIAINSLKLFLFEKVCLSSGFSKLFSSSFSFNFLLDMLSIFIPNCVVISISLGSQSFLSILTSTLLSSSFLEWFITGNCSRFSDLSISRACSLTSSCSFFSASFILLNELFCSFRIKISSCCFSRLLTSLYSSWLIKLVFSLISCIFPSFIEIISFSSSFFPFIESSFTISSSFVSIKFLFGLFLLISFTICGISFCSGFTSSICNSSFWGRISSFFTPSLFISFSDDFILFSDVIISVWFEFKLSLLILLKNSISSFSVAWTFWEDSWFDGEIIYGGFNPSLVISVKDLWSSTGFKLLVYLICSFIFVSLWNCLLFFVILFWRSLLISETISWLRNFILFSIIWSLDSFFSSWWDSIKISWLFIGRISSEGSLFCKIICSLGLSLISLTKISPMISFLFSSCFWVSLLIFKYSSCSLFWIFWYVHITEELLFSFIEIWISSFIIGVSTKESLGSEIKSIFFLVIISS